MATDKQIAANRRNAQRSTGPRTAAGKKIASRNAFRHGLSVSATEEEIAYRDVEALARKLAASDPGLQDVEGATEAANFFFEIDRICQVRRDLFAVLDLTTATPKELWRLLAVDRYEIRARSKRRGASVKASKGIPADLKQGTEGACRESQ